MRAINSPAVTWLVLACFLAGMAPGPGVWAAGGPAADDRAGLPGPGAPAAEPATGEPAGGLEPVPVQPSGDESLARCGEQGRELASVEVPTGGSFAAGLGVSLLVPLFGVGIAWFVPGKPSPPYDLVPQGQTPQCQLAFIEGYQREGQARKRRAAVSGALLGTGTALALAFLVVVSATGD